MVFGTGTLPMTVVPFGLVNCTHRYMLENGNAPPESAIFAEVLGERGRGRPCATRSSAQSRCSGSPAQFRSTTTDI
jgi:hypothetical protein